MSIRSSRVYFRQSSLGIALALLILYFLSGTVFFNGKVALASEEQSLPSMKGNGGWLTQAGKSDPPELGGKVVLFDFWDYTCINCIRTFPHLNYLYKKYRNQGLVIVGIHSPEFSFAAVPSRVEHAIKQYSLSFPVVMDNDQILWNRFHNHYWPADYLYDKKGHLLYHSFGEGGYDRLEQKIREALALDAVYRTSGASPDFPAGLTPELYAGYERGRLGNPSGYHPGTWASYLRRNLREGALNLSGRWKAFDDHLTSGSPVKHRSPSLTVIYRGTGVNAVIKPPSYASKEVPAQVQISEDGKPVPTKYAGTDVKKIPEKRSIVHVRRARMYSLVSGEPYGIHRIDLFFLTKGTEVYTLTFNP